MLHSVLLCIWFPWTPPTLNLNLVKRRRERGGPAFTCCRSLDTDSRLHEWSIVLAHCHPSAVRSPYVTRTITLPPFWCYLYLFLPFPNMSHRRPPLSHYVPLPSHPLPFARTMVPSHSHPSPSLSVGWVSTPLRASRSFSCKFAGEGDEH